MSHSVPPDKGEEQEDDSDILFPSSLSFEGEEEESQLGGEFEQEPMLESGLRSGDVEQLEVMAAYNRMLEADADADEELGFAKPPDSKISNNSRSPVCGVCVICEEYIYLNELAVEQGLKYHKSCYTCPRCNPNSPNASSETQRLLEELGDLNFVCHGVCHIRQMIELKKAFFS